MNLTVDYIGRNGIQEQQIHRLSRIGLVKHMAVAGQNFSPALSKLMRTIGMFLNYSPYLRMEAFRNNRFSEPDILYYNGYERGVFANLVGLAISDYLSKRIDQSIFSINYEAALKIFGYSLNDQRPDLLCFTDQFLFAVESKGRTSQNPGNMDRVKIQSQQGPMDVNFSVASVTYNLYNQVLCKYYDPINKDFLYGNNLIKQLSANYYKGLLDFLDHKNFHRRVIQVHNEDFYEIDILSDKSIFDLTYFKFYCPLKLIVPFNIRELAEQGISKETKPFLFIPTEDEKEKIYIDYDRIGLSMM